VVRAAGSQEALAEQTRMALGSRAGSTADPRHEAMVGRAAAAMLIGSDARRHRAFLAALDEMKPEDANAVHRLLASSMDHGVLYENEWEAFWTRWGEIDGAAAMALTLSLTHEAVPKDVRRIMRGWGATDPEAAARWLEEHQEKQFDDALVGLTDGYAARDLHGATALALNAAPSGDPQLPRLMETLSEQALRQGRAPALLAWFEQLPRSGEPEGARAVAVGHVSWRLTRMNTDKAMEWVGQQSSAPWRSDRVIAELADKVSERDPAKAAEWLQSLPPAKDGSYPGLGAVVQRWSRTDPLALEKWMKEGAAGPAREQAQAALEAERAKVQRRAAAAAAAAGQANAQQN
jgi:hypothetical protein